MFMFVTNQCKTTLLSRLIVVAVTLEGYDELNKQSPPFVFKVLVGSSDFEQNNITSNEKYLIRQLYLHCTSHFKQESATYYVRRSPAQKITSNTLDGTHVS